MRLLVTGALGTLGRPLLRELRERGHEAWGCDLGHSGDPQHVRADVAEYRQLDDAFEHCNPEAVYHLAAEFGRLNGEAYYEPLWRTAMVGTRNVLKLCSEFNSRLIFASSSEVYGEVDADLLREDLTESVVIHHPNEYALSKYANERQIEAFQARRPELDAVRLRFFNAYGPGEGYHAYRSVVALFCHKALTGEPLPVYRGYHRTFMFIDDFIPTLANVCEADLRWPVYNIGGEDYRPVEDLARIVLTSHPSLQPWAGGIELIGEDVHNIRSKRPDNQRAAADLDHAPSIPLEQGVPITLEWMAIEERLRRAEGEGLMPTGVKLESRFTEIIAELPIRTKEGCSLVCDQVVVGAKQRCPVGERAPHLRDSIHKQAGDTGYFVVAGDSETFYGHMVEFGTVHAAAHPFLIPALEAEAGPAAEAAAIPALAGL